MRTNTRGPYTQRRYRKELDCGRQNHQWHVPLYWPDRDTYCSRCFKVRRKMKKRA